MPVYNTGKDLYTSIGSVMAQTCSDWEMILVDDCSTDSSGIICDKLAASDPRISVIHASENRGLSTTRNEGMSYVQGQYVLFMDSDDILEADLLTKVNQALKMHPVQMLIFSMMEDYYDESGRLCRSYPVRYPDRYFTDIQKLREEMIYIEKSTLLGYAWNKFYSIDFLRKNELKFETITLIEDIVFNVKVFSCLASLQIIDYIGYHYNKRCNESLTGKFVPDYFALHKRRVSILYEVYKSWNMVTSDVVDILCNLYVRYIYSALQRNCDKRAKMNYKTRKLWLKTLYNDELFKILMPTGRPQGRLASIMFFLLNKRYVLVTLIVARLMYIVKNKMPILFAGLKRKD